MVFSFFMLEERKNYYLEQKYANVIIIYTYNINLSFLFPFSKNDQKINMLRKYETKIEEN